MKVLKVVLLVWLVSGGIGSALGADAVLDLSGHWGFELDRDIPFEGYGRFYLGFLGFLAFLWFLGFLSQGRALTQQ